VSGACDVVINHHPDSRQLSGTVQVDESSPGGTSPR
jgi:hypothetical protein